jgi:hypothetical protein
MKIQAHSHGVLLALVAATVFLAGCGEIKVRVGRQVVPALIESKLIVGQSTARDVHQMLGEPLGMGREWLPFHDQARTVWSYYYEEGQVSLSGPGDYHRKFIWIFLQDDRYDGYLWVSNFPGDRVPP